ncbi:hypothetical protein [Sphingobium sp.]|uniref:hypothetical protein n=1 Tax=Sphingobium sp. TaxID=1912891 RepID=UPI00262AA49E|nr:hypothetical protein [Sphingobium sp.]
MTGWREIGQARAIGNDSLPWAGLQDNERFRPRILIWFDHALHILRIQSLLRKCQVQADHSGKGKCGEQKAGYRHRKNRDYLSNSANDLAIMVIFFFVIVPFHGEKHASSEHGNLEYYERNRNPFHRL